jgi:H+/Cl- antiporter ClcA
MAASDHAPGEAPATAAGEPSPQIKGRAYLRLILLGAAIGIPASLLAVGFMAAVHELEELLWHDLPDALDKDSPPWYLILGLPLVGAVIVVLARRSLPGDGGHNPVEGLNASPTPAAYAPGVALAALGSLPFGAVLGPEAPLIALGSAVGMVVAPWANLGEKEKAVLGTAGSFAAIAALFGGPIPAGVLLIEAGVALGAAVVPLLLPGLVAAALGYLIFTGLGDWGGVEETTLAVPNLPAYDGTNIPDLLVGVAVGVLAAILIGAIHRLAREVDGLEGRRLGLASLLLAGAGAVGALALLADGLGANPEDVLFSGQQSLPDLLAEGSAGIVVVLLAAKGLAYAISLGAGFRGGPVFPAIFIGVALATLAVIAFDVSTTLAVAVGTAAGMAAATKLVFSSLVIAALLVGSAGVDAVPAAVLAAVAAWITVNALERAREPEALPATGG